ncbi:MAG: sugar phosphorylase [archaeon]
MTPALLEHLTALYGETATRSILPEIEKLVEKYRRNSRPVPLPDESTVALICYGDSFQAPGEPPLKTLNIFLSNYLKDFISNVHLLPFFPYSSDDGFSVIDYKFVNPAFGDWPEIETLGASFDLIFDAVVNHISAQSDWFREYLAGNPAFDNFFIETDPDADLSAVTRARSHPLLTNFLRNGKSVNLWTTFSADQIDLNFHNPAVLLRLLDVLLFYARQSARIIRLDAIGHAWKSLGTTCLNLPEAHLLVQVFRAALDMVFPDVLLLTETNVPHAENIQYFGDGRNEAQLVYQFPLAGLVIHSFQSGNAVKLTRWAQTLALNSNSCTYFNLLASHDGIGVRPLIGILTDAEIDALVRRTFARGGYVSYKTADDGTSDPYEMNITLFDMLADPELDEPTNIRKFITAHAILLAMPGIPALYYHSLFGSSGDRSAVETTGQKRAVNRKKFDLPDLENELNNSTSRTCRIFTELKRLIAIRKRQPAFNPYGRANVISITDRLFAIQRISPDGRQIVLAVHNLSERPVQFRITDGIFPQSEEKIRNLLTNSNLNVGEEIVLEPFSYFWFGRQKALQQAKTR